MTSNVELGLEERRAGARACAYYFDADHGCVFLRWNGSLGGQFILDCVARVSDEPAFQPGFNMFNDYRQAGFAPDFGYEFVVERFEKQARALESRRQPARSAHLAAGPADFGVLRMAIQVMETMEEGRLARRPFLRLEEALAWLDLPEDYRFAFDTDDGAVGVIP